MKKFLLLLLSVFSVSLFAQQKEEIHLIKGYTYSAELPFRLVQNLIVLDNIIIEGRKGSFIFDTGNQAALVLNSASFKEEISQALNRHSNTDTAKGITGNIPVSTSIKIDSLTLTNDFTFGGLDAVAFDLEHVKKTFGNDFLGFIGYGILRELEFAINYDKKIIHIYRLNDKGSTFEEPLYKRKPFLNFTLEKGSIMANIYFAGKMLNFFLDTGAPKNSLNSSLLPELDKSFISFTGLKDTVSGGNGKSIVTDDALMLLMTVNAITFSYMDTNVYPFPGNAQYSATLGYPFFSQKMLAVNYRKRQIYLCE